MDYYKVQLEIGQTRGIVLGMVGVVPAYRGGLHDP